MRTRACGGASAGRAGSRGASCGARAPPARAPRSPQLLPPRQQQRQERGQENAAAGRGRRAKRARQSEGSGRTPAVRPTGASPHPRRRPRQTVRGAHTHGLWDATNAEVGAPPRRSRGGTPIASHAKGSQPAAKPRAPRAADRQIKQNRLQEESIFETQYVAHADHHYDASARHSWNVPRLCAGGPAALQPLRATEK